MHRGLAVAHRVRSYRVAGDMSLAIDTQEAMEKHA
jgi:hypothetical protein